MQDHRRIDRQGDSETDECLGHWTGMMESSYISTEAAPFDQKLSLNDERGAPSDMSEHVVSSLYYRN